MNNVITKSSGNVYADLGYASASAMQIKANIVRSISRIMEERQLTQKTVAELTGMPQGRISNILSGKFRGVSEYKLLHCLSLLGNDIEIRVVPTQGYGKIVFA